MAIDPDGSKWLLQNKLREYYVQSAFGDDIEQAQKQLYLAWRCRSRWRACRTEDSKIYWS